MEKQTHYPTNEAARALGVQGATMRRGYCVQGHYMGMVPVKLPNHRLLWPAKAVEQLLQPADKE